MNFYLFMEKYIYLGVESYLIIMIFLLLSSMFGEFAEKRILAFLVYFELSHLLFVKDLQTVFFPFLLSIEWPGILTSHIESYLMIAEHQFTQQSCPSTENAKGHNVS